MVAVSWGECCVLCAVCAAAHLTLPLLNAPPPPGNPQVGSGGAGSGGLIKIITSSESVGSQLSANGGARPILQGWPGACV